MDFISDILNKKNKTWRLVEELGMEVGTGETGGMEMIAEDVATLVTTRSVSMVEKQEPTLRY